MVVEDGALNVFEALLDPAVPNWIALPFCAAPPPNDEAGAALVAKGFDPIFVVCVPPKDGLAGFDPPNEATTLFPNEAFGPLACAPRPNEIGAVAILAVGTATPPTTSDVDPLAKANGFDPDGAGAADVGALAPVQAPKGFDGFDVPPKAIGAVAAPEPNAALAMDCCDPKEVFMAGALPNDGVVALLTALPKETFGMVRATGVAAVVDPFTGPGWGVLAAVDPN
jgi:hypothetical protein